MEKPEIAVIIPVYYDTPKNGLLFYKALASLETQTFTNFQLIVVDDCSPNDVEEVLNAIQIPSICIHIEENVGPGLARQEGIKFAADQEIPYIYFMDADDMLLPYTLQTFYNAMTRQNVDVVCAKMFSEPDTKTSAILDIMDSQDGITWVFNKLYRTQFLIDNNICFHPDLRMHEDLFFTCVLMAYMGNKNAIEMQDPLYYWRSRNDSYTHTVPVSEIWASYVRAACLALEHILNSEHPENIHLLGNCMFHMYSTYETLKGMKYEKLDDLDEMISKIFSDPEFQKHMNVLEMWDANLSRCQNFILYNSKLNDSQFKLKDTEVADQIMLFQDTLYDFLTEHGFQIDDYILNGQTAGLDSRFITYEEKE